MALNICSHFYGRIIATPSVAKFYYSFNLQLSGELFIVSLAKNDSLFLLSFQSLLLLLPP